jgi:hypothetical protein
MVKKVRTISYRLKLLSAKPKPLYIVIYYYIQDEMAKKTFRNQTKTNLDLFKQEVVFELPLVVLF